MRRLRRPRAGTSSSHTSRRRRRERALPTWPAGLCGPRGSARFGGTSRLTVSWVSRISRLSGSPPIRAPRGRPPRERDRETRHARLCDGRRRRGGSPVPELFTAPTPVRLRRPTGLWNPAGHSLQPMPMPMPMPMPGPGPGPRSRPRPSPGRRQPRQAVRPQSVRAQETSHARRCAPRGVRRGRRERMPEPRGQRTLAAGESRRGAGPPILRRSIPGLRGTPGARTGEPRPKTYAICSPAPSNCRPTPKPPSTQARTRTPSSPQPRPDRARARPHTPGPQARASTRARRSPTPRLSYPRTHHLCPYEEQSRTGPRRGPVTQPSRPRTHRPDPCAEQSRTVTRRSPVTQLSRPRTHHPCPRAKRPRTRTPRTPGPLSGPQSRPPGSRVPWDPLVAMVSCAGRSRPFRRGSRGPAASRRRGGGTRG